MKTREQTFSNLVPFSLDSAPNRPGGHPVTVEIGPRRRDGSARHRPVWRKLPGGLPAFAMTAGPDTLCLYQYSHTHWTATGLASSWGQGSKK